MTHEKGVEALPLLVTFTRTAAIIGVSRSTVYRLVKCGRLQTVQLGGAPRITRESIENFTKGGAE